MKPATPKTTASPSTQRRNSVSESFHKQFIFLVACLASLTNGASAAPLRFVADVYGSTQHDRQESLTAPVSTSVSGNFAVPPYGTAQWIVSANTDNGMLAARANYVSVSTNGSGIAPDVGGSALAFIDDTLYFSRNQGVVQLAVTLALSGSCSVTPGNNRFGGPRATCSGGLSVFISEQDFFGVGPGTEETRIRFIATDGAGSGDIVIPITYSLSVKGTAQDGVADGDFSHTGHLYLSAAGGFRTESGKSYSAPPPTLNVQSAGNNVLISWPAAAQGYQLESTTNLAAGNQWDAVTNTPVLVGPQNMVTNSISSSARFFRLKK